MKSLLLTASIILSWGPAIYATESKKEVMVCKLEGKDLEIFRDYSRWTFPKEAIAGEIVLSEYIHQTGRIIAPTRLSAQKFYYVQHEQQNEDGTTSQHVVRKVMPGSPLFRLGHASLNDTIALSYDGTYSSTRSFQIMASKDKSVISYAQGGYEQRGFQHPINCTVKSSIVDNVPPLDLASLNNEELVQIIDSLGWRNRRAIGKDSDVIPAERLSEIKKNLLTKVNAFDFNTILNHGPNAGDAPKFEWSNDNGCGKLDTQSYRNQVYKVSDYTGQIIGYILPAYRCTNTLKYTKIRYNTNTGEPYHIEEKRGAGHSGVYLDKKFNILEEKEIRFNTHYIY